jgi:UDP-glucose:(heptosyl)LPS alpha-1,3-glucosyltransferase
MKIGLARRGYSPTGGAEAYLKRFAEALLPAGHEPVLFSTAAWPDADWPGGGSRGTVLPGSSPRAFAEALERASGECDFLYSLERVGRCDAYRAGDGVHRAWLERRKKGEPFWKRWGRAFNRKHRELLALEERLFSPEGAGRVIANSKMVRDEIIIHYGYPAERIHVVYNGLPGVPAPSPESRSRLRAELGFTDNDCMILFAGSGWERKGLRQAVQAVNRARFARPTRLVVAGRGNPRGMPRSERVHYAGAIKSPAEMAAYYAAADLFLAPTLYDPFSNACLEALAVGLPVITTTANGFSEIIRSGVEGEAIADPFDVASIAAALEGWNDPERLAIIRPRLRELAARYGIEANVRETLAALDLVKIHHTRSANPAPQD